MRFGIFYYGTEPKNRGLGQLALSLESLGHKTFIINRMGKSGKRIAHFQNTPVIQLPLKSNFFSNLRNTPLPMNWNWEKWAFELAVKYKFDGMFVRETPLSNQIIAAAIRLGIPVYLDMRENLAAMYKTRKKRTLIRRITRPIKPIKWYESWVLPRFTHIFTVSEELGKWASKQYTVSPNKISTLSNYPSSLFLTQAKEACNKTGKLSSDGKIILVHAGYVMENRGLQDLLRAIKIILSKGFRHVHLKVIGHGDYIPELKRMSIELGISGNVEFLPMLPPERVARALSECQIGICSYLLNEQTHQTLPGKLFEYMAVGLPVITSARKPVVRIVEKEKCGTIYYSRDPKEIAQKIIKLVDNIKLMQKMGERSKKAIFQRYNQQANIDVLKSVLKRC